MNLYKNASEIKSALKGVVTLSQGGKVSVDNPKQFRDTVLDTLVSTAVFCEDPPARDAARWLIRATANALGAVSSSIQGLYDAIGQNKVKGFTVPAVNIRGLTYDVARAIFRTGLKHNSGTFVFEIAKSEIGYTAQRPAEYAPMVLAAAVREGYTGPVFIQGDHFQFAAKKYKENPQGEMNEIRKVTKEAIEAGFFNIDIDSSTLVDLTRPTVKDQQRDNYLCAAELTHFIRGLEPKGVTISVGGEIGEVGKKNSTVEEFDTYMLGYREELDKRQKGLKGISKMSVQTGTSHGGIPLPDGSIARVDIDFSVHDSISAVARKKYGMAGTVQHGASTLPEVLFDKFPQTTTAEIHLATEFQNMIYDNAAFPKDLKEKINQWCRDNCKDEFKADQTDIQNVYKTRKKAFGPFKKELWSLDAGIRAKIGQALEAKFDTLFKKLNAVNTKSIITDHVKPVKVDVPMPASLV